MSEQRPVEDAEARLWAAAGKLVTHPLFTQDLGKIIRRGDNAARAVRAMLNEFGLGGQLASAIAPLFLSAKGELLIRGLNPRTFWDRVCEVGDWPISAPEFPTLSEAVARTCVEFGLVPVFMPGGVLEKVVAGFPGYILPFWGRKLSVSNIERRSLPGRWVVVEVRPKPDWDDPNGYGPDDKMAEILELATRFGTSWNTPHGGRLNILATALGLSPNSVRLPTAEEANFVGNLFLLANRAVGTTLPNLGSSRSWEWCENSYGFGNRLVFGNSEGGGLAAVDWFWRSDTHHNLGFRVLAVLS